MIKSFPLYSFSIPDFDSPFLCLDLPASYYELEMKHFILFLFLLLFYYHAVLAQPCLTFFFSSALLQFLSLHLLTLEKQLLSCAKNTPISSLLYAKPPLLQLLIVMITTNSLWQFLLITRGMAVLF